MQTSVTKNNAWDFRNHEWNILIDSNGLLIMWFLEWNQKAKDNPLQIQDFFAQKYNQSAGCNPCLLYTSPSPRDQRGSRMPSSA